MLSIIQFFFEVQQLRIPREPTNAEIRREWARQRKRDLLAARRDNAVSQKEFNERWRYWTKVEQGSIGSGVTLADLRSAGRFY